MKRLILVALMTLGFTSVNAQYYQLRYDSVRIVSKFKLGTVATGASTDSLLTKKANGGVYKIAQSAFSTTASLSDKANLTSPNNTFTNVNNFTGNTNFSLTPASLGGNGYRFWNTVNTFSGVISAPTLTSNRTYTLPDASGTLATQEYVDAILSTSNVVSVSGTSATALSGKVYQTLNASLTTITLPASPVNGATVIVNGIGAGKWRLQHGSGTVLIKGVGGFTTVAGTGKGVETADQYGTIGVRYESTTNVWVVTSQNGSIAAY